MLKRAPIAILAVIALSTHCFAQGSDSSSNSATTDFTNWTGTVDSSKLPKGTTSITSSNAEATYIAYQATLASADAVATKVCDAVTSEKGSSLLLFSNLTDIDALRNLFVARNQLIAFKAIQPQLYNTIQLQPVDLSPLKLPNPFLNPMGPTGVSGLPLYQIAAPPAGAHPLVVVPILSAVDAVLSLVALFKKDTQITGATISTDDLSYQFMIASRLKANCSDLKILQTVYSLPPLQKVAAVNPISNSSILALVFDALQQQNDLQNQGGLLQTFVISPLNVSIGQVQKAIGSDTPRHWISHTLTCQSHRRRKLAMRN